MGNSERMPWLAQATAKMRRFAADSSGATVVEYALIAATIGAVVVAGTTEVSSKLVEIFGRLSDLFS